MRKYLTGRRTERKSPHGASTMGAGIALALTALMASPALAHHPLGGATPTTFWHGLLSGIGHPILGLDHFAFLVAAGVAAAFINLRYAGPAIFILATLMGCVATLAVGSSMPHELLVATSVALIGIMVLSGRAIAAPIYAALFAVAGICHGAAYAGAMVGAEPTPIAAYLIGLGLIQFAIAATMTYVTRNIWQANVQSALQPRLAGAVVAGIGLTILFEHVEKLVLPSL